jgi:hypothetical protein
MIPISACGNLPPKKARTQNIARLSQTRDYIKRLSRTAFASISGYNLPMRFPAPFFILFFAVSVLAQAIKPAPPPTPASVTVPITLDHNRILIDVDLPLPDGSTQRVRGWVDNGNPELTMSRHAAALLALNITCNDQACSALPPPDLIVHGMKISLSDVKLAEIPLKPVDASSVMASGLPAEINLPSTVLRHYDVLVNFPNHELTLTQPGTLKFTGTRNKVFINQENGLIQIPGQIDNKKYNLALDLGASISFLSEPIFEKLAVAHPIWPRMTGAIGPANLWGLTKEPQWKLMRVDRVPYGSVFLTGVPFVAFSSERWSFFEKRAGLPTAGLIGSQALLNYRIGIDYAHSAVYFEVGRTFNFPDFDVVGLILRPEDDGRFTILGIADYEGKPSVPSGEQGIQPGDHLVAVNGIPTTGSAMGQVWSMLGGTPGQERRLTIERKGKRFDVTAIVQRFLNDAQDQKK